MPAEAPELGVGFYGVPEAARLLKLRARSINRWLGGYSYRQGSRTRYMPPLWQPQLERGDDHLELSFRDLIELRFVKAFIEAGLGLQTIRSCLAYARDCVGDGRPFSTHRFLTDGRTIFLDSAMQSGEAELLDLKSKQYTLKQVIERTFKDLDIDADAVVRWRPYAGKKSIVIDPERSFGQPITAASGVPTVVLAQALDAEGSIERVSRLYEVPRAAIKDAVAFEQSLQRA